MSSINDRNVQPPIQPDTAAAASAAQPAGKTTKEQENVKTTAASVGKAAEKAQIVTTQACDNAVKFLKNHNAISKIMGVQDTAPEFSGFVATSISQILEGTCQIQFEKSEMGSVEYQSAITSPQEVNEWSDLEQRFEKEFNYEPVQVSSTGNWMTKMQSYSGSFEKGSFIAYDGLTKPTIQVTQGTVLQYYDREDGKMRGETWFKNENGTYSVYTFPKNENEKPTETPWRSFKEVLMNHRGIDLSKPVGKVKTTRVAASAAASGKVQVSDDERRLATEYLKKNPDVLMKWISAEQLFSPNSVKQTVNKIYNLTDRYEIGVTYTGATGSGSYLSYDVDAAVIKQWADLGRKAGIEVRAREPESLINISNADAMAKLKDKSGKGVPGAFLVRQLPREAIRPVQVGLQTVQLTSVLMICDAKDQGKIKQIYINDTNEGIVTFESGKAAEFHAKVSLGQFLEDMVKEGRISWDKVIETQSYAFRKK